MEAGETVVTSVRLLTASSIPSAWKSKREARLLVIGYSTAKSSTTTRRAEVCDLPETALSEMEVGAMAGDTI